jgi:hypothetical protein
MHPAAALRLALDPSGILEAQDITPDPWQRDLLASTAPQTLLNCSRQSGKSTTVAVLALHTALFTPKSLTLLLSPTQRQSGELFRKVLNAYNALGRPIKTVGETQMKCEFDNGSRIVCLPGKEETIRSFSSVNLLIIDEAALAKWPISLVLVEQIRKRDTLCNFETLIELPIGKHEREEIITRLVVEPSLVEQLQVPFDPRLNLHCTFPVVHLDRALVPLAPMPEHQPITAPSLLNGCHVAALPLPGFSPFSPQATGQRKASSPRKFMECREI